MKPRLSQNFKDLENNFLEKLNCKKNIHLNLYKNVNIDLFKHLSCDKPVCNILATVTEDNQG